MNNSINRTLTIAIVLLTTAVSAVIIISIWQSQRIKNFNTEITRYEENRYYMQQLTAAVLDNETGARGYVITRNKEFLQPMIASEQKLDELRTLLLKTTVTPAISILLKDSLSPVIDNRKAFSRKMMAFTAEGKTEEAKKLIMSGVGKRYTDEARRLAAKIDRIRNELLDARRKNNENFIQTLNLLLISTLIILLGLSVFNFRQLRLSFKKQKEAETQLRQNEQLYAALFYKSPIVKWIVSPVGNRIIDVNDSFCKFLNVKKEDIIGKSTAEAGFSNSPEVSEAVYRQLKETGYVRNLEYKTTLPSGESKWVSMSIDPLKLNGQDCIVGASADITAHKQNEELIANMNVELERKVKEKTAEIRESEQKLKALNETLEHLVEQRTGELVKANKELEAFSYSVSHDLRAPLRGIIGFTNILEEEYGKHMQPEEKRLFGIIKKNTEKMGSLIDGLLHFSRLGRKEISKTKVDTQLLVNDVIEELKKTIEHPAVVNWEVEVLPAVEADIFTIRQVWTNLLSNAIKYSKQNAAPLIRIGSYKEKNETVFFIKDNGVGFDEKYKEKLFQVFQRLHSQDEFEGTGVGLALVEKIISKHEGKVWATAEPGNGACFSFSLP